MWEIIGTIVIVYLLIAVLYCFLGLLGLLDLISDNIEDLDDINDPKYIALYPIIPFMIGIIYFKKFKNYLLKNNLNQMNIKILLKAMSFMFLPTFAVLLMLLVGFFDPIALWTFIKSDSGWAITIRVLLFLAEMILVAILYFDYLEKDKQANLLKEVSDTTKVGEEKSIDRSDYVRNLFNYRDGGLSYFKTSDKNYVLVKLTPKN